MQVVLGYYSIFCLGVQRWVLSWLVHLTFVLILLSIEKSFKSYHKFLPFYFTFLTFMHSLNVCLVVVKTNELGYTIVVVDNQV